MINNELEPFDHEVYARTSDNNMPFFASFEEISSEEQKDIDAALALS